MRMSPEVFPNVNTGTHVSTAAMVIIQSLRDFDPGQFYKRHYIMVTFSVEAGSLFVSNSKFRPPKDASEM